MEYKVLFDNGGIPMWMPFLTKKEADNFCKSGVKVLDRKEE